MLYDTPQKLQKRKEEFEAQDIARIQKWKDKKKAAWFLQNKYGLDCDYLPGIDDGEQPKHGA